MGNLVLHYTQKTGVFLLALFLALFTVANTALGQQITAQIKGVVTDATGAAVPDAQVTATNTQTGVTTTVPSDNNGNFQFLQLPIGTYDVAVTKTGFSTFTTTHITLALNQIYNLPVTLQVGAVSQAVEVQANPAQVETTATQMGTVIQGKQIVDVPLNGRNWVSLQQLAPGVVSGSDRLSSSGNYATNGSESQQNSFLINGVDDIDLTLNTPSVIPSPDAIAEFNLIDSTINPEYGRNSGGVLNAVIKSGTNQFHGDAFEFYRDTFLNGRNIYQATKPVFHQNQFGGTIGGPIWKDHTFFFLSYQGTRFREPEPGAATQSTVFTTAQRGGAFSDLSTSTGTSATPLVGDSGLTYPAGTPYRTIFSGGYIPAADMNPLAVKLMNTYVPTANTGSNLYSFNPTRSGNYNQGISKIDHTFGQHDAMWVSLTFENDPFIDTVPFPPYGSSLPGFPDQNIGSYKFLTGDWTHTFSPTTLNDLRVSYLRFNYADLQPVNSASPSSYGFSGITPEFSDGQAAPYISLTGYFNLGFTEYGPQPRLDQTYELADSFSKIVGNHTIKVGFDGKRYDVHNPYEADNNGNYSFGGAGAYSTGDPGADFLLGLPDTYLQESGGVINARTFEYYGYFQDSWKVNDNLTVNYGAGYQVDTPLVNRSFGAEDSNCFRPGQQSTVFPTAPLGLLFPGDKTCSASGYYPHYDHIGPRAGFAYSPGSGSNKKFVIRGGFGIYFNRSEEELALQDLGAPPYSILYENASGPSFANPYKNVATGATAANPFPFAPPAKGSAVDFSAFEPMELNVLSPNFTSPYAMNFNLNVQRELPGAMIFQIAYVGSLGRHLELAYEGNPISPAGQAACAASPACTADRLNQHPDYPSHAEFAPGDIFASVGTQATDGSSSYSSLQVSLQKRLNHGLTFQGSYTWSHALDNTSGYESTEEGYRAENPYNFGENYGDSFYDARQRFVISYDYQIPSISRFWDNWVTREVFGGWHLSGITTLQTGLPILIADTADRSLTCDAYAYYGCWDAPNVLATPTIYDPRTSSVVNSTKGGTASKNYYYFNPNDFAVEPIGVLGNEGRDNFHGPGINNTDLTLMKDFYLNKEQARYLELRVDSFNVFNHTQFSPVAITNSGTGVYGDINSSNFGRVLNATTGRTIQLAAKFYF